MNEGQRVLSHLTEVLTHSHHCPSEESLSPHRLQQEPGKIYWKAQIPTPGVAKFTSPQLRSFEWTLSKPGCTLSEC